MDFNKQNRTYFSHSPLWLLVLVAFAAACSRPVVKIENLPENTPPGSGIYIAGNFNRWDSGDERFRFEMDSDSNYYFTVPRGFGNLEFKITRGEWSNVETDICGYDIENRSFGYGTLDTFAIDVLSWKDLEPINCPELTIVVENIPENTPDGDPIALAGNFNEWSPDSSSYLQRDTGSGKYMIKLPRVGLERLLEFKVTRGNLLTAEADKYGYEIDKRKVKFGLTDTLYIDVENWEDIVDVPQNSVAIILDDLPDETPAGEEIYITGSFNGWYPKDPKYRFEKNEKGKYQYIMPRKADFIEFKITRGDWSKEEVDILGYKMGNRKFEFGSADTLLLTIHGWLDQTTIKQPTYTFLIEKLPPATPANADLYMAGTINGWSAGKRKHRFKLNEKGKYYLTLKNGMRSIEYKITRGDWDSQEADKNGFIIPNRQYDYNGEDTIKIRIDNWLDKPEFRQDKVVILLEEVPESTPADRHIYIAGSFNNWNPGSPNYILNKNLKGEYYITIPANSSHIEFKFTLGSWEYEELDNNGGVIPNRFYNFGFTDTLRLKVDRWEGYQP